MGVFAQIAQGGGDPYRWQNYAINAQRNALQLQAAQFELQQQQRQLAFGRLNALRGTPNLTYDQINAALGSARRMGADTAPFEQDIALATANNVSPQEYVRQLGAGVAPGGLQYEAMQPQPFQMQTGQGTYFGYQGGSGGPVPYVPTPFGFAQRGFTPGEATDIQQVGVDPQTGRAIYQPRGVTFGQPYGGGAGGGQGGARSPLSALVANLESGGGRDVANQPSTMVNPVYGQYGAFGRQYGTGPAGVENYAAQVLANNPRATLGDFYSGYVRGTGDPADTGTVDDLAREQPGAYRNLVNNAGLSPDTPLAALVGRGAPYQVAGAGPNVPVPSGSFAAPSGGLYLPSAPGGGAGAGGGYTGYTGMPIGAPEVIAGNIHRQQQLEAQMNNAYTVRANLQGMEAELSNMPTSGVTAGPLATLKNAIVSSGFANQQTVDEQSKGLAAQEQFDKFSSLLNQQLLQGMGGQATDARQELTGASTPSSIHSKLGNLGIIHMLEGNISALQVMGRMFRQQVNTGQATPQQFDAWRDNFTAPTKDGARFDPRVFWMANMGPDEQAAYGASLSAKDQAQLKRNVQFAEQNKWIYDNPDGSFGTAY